MHQIKDNLSHLDVKKINLTNLTKQRYISKEIHKKLGLSISYTSEIVKDITLILKDLIKLNKINIKNFGTFKILFKKERLGRSPKTKRKLYD